MLNDGIYSTIGKCFIVKATENQNQVLVQSGRAWFDHTWNYLDSDMMFEVEPSNFLLDRIDAIVIDVNSDVDYRENSIKMVVGTPSSNPERPALESSSDHKQYPLCYIYRKSNVEIIDQEDITNMVGTSSTPFVTAILDHISTDDLILQWQNSWDNFIKRYGVSATEWMNARKEEYLAWYDEIHLQFNEFMSDSGNTFYNWFEGIKNVLSTDAAGNLQLEVEDLYNNTIYVDKDTIFNSDGTIKDIYTKSGRYEITEFDEDGTITNTLYSGDHKVLRVSVTTFDSDGNIHHRLNPLYKRSNYR
jgi:hypothetical protein